MKQKRKVKNLLQEKEVTTSNILTAFLFMLSWILCLWAIAIFSLSKVSLAEQVYVNPQDVQQLEYVWVTDKTETLYEVKFVNPIKISEDIHSIKLKWTSVYISPKPVIVNPKSTETSNDMIYPSNKVSTDVYSNILWWMGNTVNSKNVTIIAWEWNTVNPSNENATLLWWKGNTLDGNVGKSAVMLGWEWNKIVNKNEWDVIVWWKKNEIWWWASYANILWWRDNTINWRRAIVWWINITVAGNEEDVFVFNNDNTKNINISSTDPKDTSDTFYLSVSEWLWINTSTTTKGVEVKWWVGFGAININKICDDSTLWVQWIWNGCLVWCTKKSKWHWWELLDYGEKCRAECAKNGKCIDTSVPYEDVVENVEWVCVEWVANTRQAVQCDGAWAEKLFYNAVFETTLIDARDTWVKCPSEGWDQSLINNRCVFQCEPGTHLTRDTSRLELWIDLWVGCFKDCTLDGKTIKHNETITGYNVSEVFCANDAGNPVSTETCGPNTADEQKSSVHHREVLLCVDGKFYLNRDKAVLVNDVTSDSAHIFDKKSCELKQYRCKTDDDNYNLTIQRLRLESGKPRLLITPSTYLPQYRDYVTPYEDQINEYVSSRRILDADDRSQPFGWMSRWRYELCIDFDGESVTNDNEQCARVVTPASPAEKNYHYKLISCSDDGSTKYRTWAVHPYECRPVYTLTYDTDTNAQFPSNNEHSSTITAEFTWWSVVPVALTDPNAPKATKKDKRDGVSYQFLWWNTDPDAHEWLTSFTMPQKNERLYAIYKRTYTANFDKNWATAIWTTQLTCQAWNNDQTCNSTDQIKWPTIRRDSKDPLNPFTILWWSTDKDSHTWTPVGQILTVPVDPKTTSTTYYAITHKVCTITFFLNGNKSQTPKWWTATIAPSVTQTNDIWNRDTKCSITSPAIDCSEVKDVQNQNNTVKKSLIWYSTAAAKHEKDYDTTTTREFEDNASFYAQCEKNITVTFKLNGNTSQTDSAWVSQLWDVTRVGTYYNGDTYFTIKSPSLDPNKVPVEKAIIWYSTASNRHENDWTINTDKNISDNMTYYAQSKKEAIVTFDKNGNLWSTVTKKCIYFNDMKYCGDPKCDTDGSNDCKAPVCPTITPNKDPVLKKVMAWSTMSNEFHTACDVNAVPNDDNHVIKDVTFYAWSKKTVQVTFDVNGNGGSNSSAECEYFNAAKSCTVSCPGITANSKPNQKTVIWWSTSSADHTKWACAVNGTSMSVNDKITFYAQSYRKVDTSFNVNKAKELSKTSTTCTYYNDQEACGSEKCDVDVCKAPTSPIITPPTNASVIWFNVWSTATTSTWSHNDAQNQYENRTYYAIWHCDPWYYRNADKNACPQCGAWNYCPGTATDERSIQCPKNNYCPTWSSTPNACPGSMTSAAWSSEKEHCMIACSAWTYLKAWWSSCSTCEAWNYCPGWTFNFNASSNQWINQCPGDMTSDAWKSAKTDCRVVCSAWTYLKKWWSSCSTCDGWYYCPWDTYYYNASSNQWINQCGCGNKCPSWSSKATQCTAGTYQDSKTATDCKSVDDGYYAWAWACSQSSCTTNAWTNYKNSASPRSTVNDCYITCEGKTYLSTAKANSCAWTCSKGKYKAKHTVSYGSKSNCDDDCTSITNMYAWTSNWTAANNCGFNCKAWYAYNWTKRTCTSCNAWTYTTDGNTSTSCSTCTAGYYCPGSSDRVQCPGSMTSDAWKSAKTDCKIVCSAWTYLKAWWSSCSTCEGWYYCPGWTFNFNASSNQWINQCGCGNKCPSWSSKATQCTAGTYQDSKTATDCKSVDNGYYAWAWSCSQSSCTTNAWTNYKNSDNWRKNINSCYISCAACSYVSTAKANSCAWSCGKWETTSAHNVYYWNTSSPTACSKPTNSHYTTACSCAWECDSWYTKHGNTCKKDCSVCGATIHHGESRTCYADNAPAWSCSSEERKCNDGTASWSYGYSYCNNGCKKPWNNEYIKHNDSITAWNYSSPTSPTMCASETRTCNNGTLWWSYTNSSCTQQYRSCTICGATVAHGGKRTCYADNAPAWSCSSEERKCNDGTASWSYGYSYCNAWCKKPWNNQYIKHNDSLTAYYDDDPAWSCYSETRTCNDGTLWWSYTYSSCNAWCKKPWNNEYIKHNESITAWNYSSPTSPTMCISESRKCNNGSLWWSYTNSSCTQKYRSCTICGATVAHGDSRVCYAYNTPAWSCYSETRTCNDGTASWTFGYSYCNEWCKLPRSNSYITHGESVSGWNYSSPTSPTMCASETRTCNNGTLWWSYTNSSCRQKYRSCWSSACGTVAHWDTCKTYVSDVALKCELIGNAVKSTCNDWAWINDPSSASGPGSYTTCRFPNWCGASSWCSYTSAWGWCNTYKTSLSNSCSSFAVSSYCWDWSYSPEPGWYSSCSAPASCWSSACGTVAHGNSCTTYSSQGEYYNRCERVSRTSKCTNGNWDQPPYDYSSCSNLWTPPKQSCWSSACGTVSDWGTCTTYSSQGEYYNRCNRVSRTSTCDDGDWDQPPYNYSSCSDLWNPDTWGWGSTSGSGYKWTYVSSSCLYSNAHTNSCTPWGSCSDVGKTCCRGGSASSSGTYYTCQ